MFKGTYNKNILLFLFCLEYTNNCVFFCLQMEDTEYQPIDPKDVTLPVAYPVDDHLMKTCDDFYSNIPLDRYLNCIENEAVCRISVDAYLLQLFIELV